MTTDDLIDQLAADAGPVPPGAVERRIALGTGAGFVVSLALMIALLGLRNDIHAAMQAPPFWLKFGYTALLSLCGLWIVERLSRPGVQARYPARSFGGVLTGMAVLAALQLATAPSGLHRALLMGSSASSCPWVIVALALPVLVGATWAMRGLAPTRLALAGAGAGLLAGSFGALVYSFACNENAMPFVAIWYTLGIGIAAAIGAILGRVMLRWS